MELKPITLSASSVGVTASQSYLMELKLKHTIKRDLFSILSIVPYGIETASELTSAKAELSSQSYLMELKLSENLKITVLIGNSQSYLMELKLIQGSSSTDYRGALNRTLWN